jgi:hypothetical protein
MPGRPTLTDAILGVDVTALTVEQPLGTPTNIVDATQIFFVAVTMQASGLSRYQPVPYRVNYYYESIGPGGEGTFNPPGVNTGNLNAVPVTSPTSTYTPAQTRFAVPANTLTQDRTWKLAATVDFPTSPGTGGFVEGITISTIP